MGSRFHNQLPFVFFRGSVRIVRSTSFAALSFAGRRQSGNSANLRTVKLRNAVLANEARGASERTLKPPELIAINDENARFA
jgi:hypothetical protein